MAIFLPFLSDIVLKAKSFNHDLREDHEATINSKNTSLFCRAFAGCHGYNLFSRICAAGIRIDLSTHLPAGRSILRIDAILLQYVHPKTRLRPLSYLHARHFFKCRRLIIKFPQVFL